MRRKTTRFLKIVVAMKISSTVNKKLELRSALPLPIQSFRTLDISRLKKAGTAHTTIRRIGVKKAQE